jgi:hypothetical protein
MYPPDAHCAVRCSLDAAATAAAKDRPSSAVFDLHVLNAQHPLRDAAVFKLCAVSACTSVLSYGADLALHEFGASRQHVQSSVI